MTVVKNPPNIDLSKCVCKILVEDMLGCIEINVVLKSSPNCHLRFISSIISDINRITLKTNKI